MSFSDDTGAVLEFLDTRSGGLRKRSDLGLVLELGAASNDYELVNGIIFYGAAVWKVFSALKKVQPGSEGYDSLEKEFAGSMNHLRALLADMISGGSDEDLRRFESIYFGMTQGVVKNLVDLSHDLGLLKDVQNEQKYGGPQGN